LNEAELKTLCAESETKLNELFNEWEQAHKRGGYENFIRDGIVSPKNWYKQKTPKICYLLKEGYTNDKGYDLAECLRNNEPWHMWKKVSVWTESIFQAFGMEKEYNQEYIIGNLRKNTDSIAVINIKKSNGKSESDYKEIEDFAVKDRDFLYRELEIINPDIIVCGYTSHCLRAILGEEWKNNETYMNLFGEWNGKLIIDYYHPAGQYPNRVNYYALMSICRVAVKKYDFLKKFVQY